MVKIMMSNLSKDNYEFTLDLREIYDRIETTYDYLCLIQSQYQVKSKEIFFIVG